MKILYVSVHQILEYDEIRLFQSLGHEVFSLGTYFGFELAEPFRPEISFGESKKHLMELFLGSNCKYSYGMPIHEQFLSPEFINNFDVVIVMHSIDFIDHHWDVISRRPVIWRTIGVNIEAEEVRIAPLRARGCKIVRFSPMERLANHYAGEDALVRFNKSPDDFPEWRGEMAQVLIFSNFIQGRFGQEYSIVADALRDFQNTICGAGNEGLPNARGIVTYDEQIQLLQSSRVYLYGLGTFITYTLNFMEAWISGIPVVVLSGRAVLPEFMFKFSEVPQFIDHGKNGFVVSSADEARQVIASLLADRDMAAQVGAAGRAAATSLFGTPTVGAQWAEYLATLKH